MKPRISQLVAGGLITGLAWLAFDAIQTHGKAGNAPGNRGFVTTN